MIFSGKRITWQKMEKDETVFTLKKYCIAVVGSEGSGLFKI